MGLRLRLSAPPTAMALRLVSSTPTTMMAGVTRRQPPPVLDSMRAGVGVAATAALPLTPACSRGKSRSATGTELARIRLWSPLQPALPSAPPLTDAWDGTSGPQTGCASARRAWSAPSQITSLLLALRSAVWSGLHKLLLLNE